MLQRIVNKVRYTLNPPPKRRELVLREPNIVPEDVFVASYPRSGNTWLRTIIAHLLYPNLDITALADLDNLVPDSHKFVLPITEYPFSTPRVIKTHRPFSFRHEPLNPALYGKFIYIVRHPFNTIRSFFHYRFSDDMSAANLQRHVEDVIYGLTIHGSWQDNVLSWHFAAQRAEALILRYEAMQQDPASHIQQIAQFLGATINDNQLADIVERTSSKYMIQMEQRGTLQGDTTPEFVRREGQRRQLAHDLTAQQKELIWTYCQQAMTLYDYTSSNDE